MQGLVKKNGLWQCVLETTSSCHMNDELNDEGASDSEEQRFTVLSVLFILYYFMDSCDEAREPCSGRSCACEQLHFSY